MNENNGFESLTKADGLRVKNALELNENSNTDPSNDSSTQTLKRKNADCMESAKSCFMNEENSPNKRFKNLENKQTDESSASDNENNINNDESSHAPTSFLYTIKNEPDEEGDAQNTLRPIEGDVTINGIDFTEIRDTFIAENETAVKPVGIINSSSTYRESFKNYSYRSKATNKRQIRLLLDAMQKHPDIALNSYKGNKDDLNIFWRDLEAVLNSAGPPMKSVYEWKKVWIDQKKYVRQKASRPNGSLNMEPRFSATEEAIYNLICLQDSVDIAPNTFGLRSSAKLKKPQDNISLDETLLENSVKEINGHNIDEASSHTPIITKPKSVQHELPTRKNPASYMFSEELRLQRVTCENTKNIYLSIDRLYDLQKQHFNAMENARKEELEEQKRHNLMMEALRLREVEFQMEKDRRLLELENLKAKN